MGSIVEAIGDYDTDTFKMVSQQDADTVRFLLKFNLTFLDTNWDAYLWRKDLFMEKRLRY